VVWRPEDKVEKKSHVAGGACGFALIVDDYFQHADSWFDNYSNATGIEMNRQERFSLEKEVTISSSAQLKRTPAEGFVCREASTPLASNYTLR
jgi:hypothetical protein